MDFGADMIIGHHSHVIQPKLVHRNKPIFFGLGGMIFGDFMTKKGLESSFQKTKKGLIINVKQNNLNYFKSSDNKGNVIKIEPFKNYLSQNKKLWEVNKFFNRNEKLFMFVQKTRTDKNKGFSFLFFFCLSK